MNSSLHDRAGQLVDLVVVEKVEKRVFYATSGELPAFYSGVVELQANALFVSLSDGLKLLTFLNLRSRGCVDGNEC